MVAEELLPSVTARLELDRVRALVTERGNKFSHSSILARSMGTPAVAGVPEAAAADQDRRSAHRGRCGGRGVRRSGAVGRARVRVASRRSSARDEEELRHLVGLPSVTRDGTAIPLLANVNKFADTEAALRYEADGIGLYRTEFAFSIRPALPDRGGAVRVPRARSGALPPAKGRLPAARPRGRQGPALLPVAALAQPVAGAARRPAPAEAPRRAEAAAARLPARQRRASGFHPPPGRGRASRRCGKPARSCARSRTS